MKLVSFGRVPARAIVLAGMLVALVPVGCSGADADSPEVSQRVTRDFGAKLLAADEGASLERPRTVLGLLRAHHEVRTDETGRGVTAIDGRRTEGESPHQTIWEMNVNGIEADVAPKDYRLHDGDVVQWDLRDWYVTLDVRATVGAFPETFTRGVFGRRFPVTVRCERPGSSACRQVKGKLRRVDVDVDGEAPPGRRPPRGLPQRAQVLVGTWSELRDRRWADLVDGGAADSGIFARFAKDGGALHLFDWDERRTRAEGAGTGLVGAVRPTEEDLMWLVTGVDELGVRRAARALDRDKLRDAFAVAVTADGIQRLPLAPPPDKRVEPREPWPEVDVTPYERPPAQAPKARIPAGPPPSRLVVEDFRVGSGPPARRWDQAVVNYVGYIHSTRRRYDTSYDPHNPLPLVAVPGRGSLIDGFERAIVGMRVGGRRQVIIPPRLGYGDRGYPPDVKPDQTLVFVIDLERLRRR